MPVRENNATLTATIPISTTTSGTVPIVGVGIGGFVTPAALTGTAFTFLVSADGSTFVGLYDQTNTRISVTVAASRAYSLPANWFAPWRYVQIVSGSTEVAARDIVLLTVPVS